MNLLFNALVQFTVIHLPWDTRRKFWERGVTFSAGGLLKCFDLDEVLNNLSADGLLRVFHMSTPDLCFEITVFVN